ncbi:MAG: hypothetical protein COY40_07045 [Alphaproteobacteria bacterium CG_4_10_14_0_8_um_filter_53_9]|nr:MAG: hypothetical protein COY40_07045 [Alphaproteobacteria bacterium CG_4_10_14_0_8_um_filter_53_9]
MNIIYARQTLPQRNARTEILQNSIFLVGPTPRKDTITPSWRPEALRLLEEMRFSGTVFVPEDSDGSPQYDYDSQIWWEIEALGRSAAIVCWLPRELRQMPAFTTNTEVGFTLALRPERCVFGFPPEAQKIKYQKALAQDINRFRKAFGLPLLARADFPPCYETLSEALVAGVRRAAR